MRILLAVVLIAVPGIAFAGSIDAKVEAALAAESRPEADVVRDRNRRPLRTLQFFGLEDDMTVIELKELLDAFEEKFDVTAASSETLTGEYEMPRLSK